MTCCYLLANNCTKLAAHENVPGQPTLCHRQLTIKKIRPTFLLALLSRGWAGECLIAGHYLSPGSGDGSRAALLPLRSIKVKDGGPDSPGSPAWGSTGLHDNTLLCCGRPPLTSLLSALRLQEDPAKLCGVQPSHRLLPGHVGPGGTHPGRGPGRVRHLLVLCGFDAEHDLCQLSSG